jgi:hypothetical protein
MSKGIPAAEARFDQGQASPAGFSGLMHLNVSAEEGRILKRV